MGRDAVEIRKKNKLISKHTSTSGMIEMCKLLGSLKSDALSLLIHNKNQLAGHVLQLTDYVILETFVVYFHVNRNIVKFDWQHKRVRESEKQ